eukprot:TRINITY_DN5579_c0_g1_i2.p1 TRINITY_DN5579_c0_g1~~TRINITY_DN5579_c0_g1_i2.p1  ORF type:complete len:344 (-),score=66.94 TRINITY_DN5579_c0_g1_i2:133-1044(-)
MSSLTPDSLQQHIQSLGIEITKIPHSPPVMTVADMESQLSGSEGKVVKNVFLKDKKGRFYIVSCLPETEVKINVLGARLGQGKTLRMAPEDALQAVLQVPSGSVTPLAVCQGTAENVILLLDDKMKQEEKLLVHPLTNSASLVLSSQQIETILKSFGREINYVDLTLEPKFNKDNPGDLKYLADAVTPPEKQNDENGNKEANSSKNKSKNTGNNSNNNNKNGTNNNQQTQKASLSPDDVDSVVEKLLQTVQKKIQDGGELSKNDIEHLRKDFFVYLNALRNTAYAGGYQAALGSVKNFIQGKR